MYKGHPQSSLNFLYTIVSNLKDKQKLRIFLSVGYPVCGKFKIQNEMIYSFLEKLLSSYKQQ
jgi:hypothetical protein